MRNLALRILVILVSVSVFTSLTAITSDAALVSYTFQGTLSSVSDSNTLLNGEFVPGQTFSGSFVYETSAQEGSTTLSDPTIAIYSAVKSFSVNINGYWIIRDSILDGYLQVWDDHVVGPSVVDAFTVDSGLDNTPPIYIGPGTTVAGADIMLFDNFHTATKHGEKIPTKISLHDYSALMFSAIELNIDTEEYFILDGTITALSPAGDHPISTPEPSTLVLLGFGALGSLCWRRKAWGRTKENEGDVGCT